MVSKNRQLQEILRRAKELKEKVSIVYDPALTFIEFETDGTITVDEQYVSVKKKRLKTNNRVFKSGSDVLDYLDGITHKNPVIIDDMAMIPDGFYIDTSLLFCMNQEELAHLCALNASDTAYMGFYLDMARKYTFDYELPENGILSDLRGCCDELTVEQLVERYSDQRWFKEV